MLATEKEANMPDDDEIFAELDREIARATDAAGGPWAAFVVRALWRHPDGATIADIQRSVLADAVMRKKAIPVKFSQTIQRSFENFNSGSEGFSKPLSDDIFCYPIGKNRGFWGLHRERASVWMKARKLTLE